MNSISERVLRLREEKKFSRKELAELAEVSQPTIYNIENGKTDNITLSVGKKIANALKISFGELFEIETNTIELENFQNDSNKLIAELKEKNEKIEEFQKRIEEKDDLIKLLKNENNDLKLKAVYNQIERLWEQLIETEIDLRNAKTEEEKSFPWINRELALSMLKNKIEKANKNGYILLENLSELFFSPTTLFCELIENESKDKNEFIKNITEYITSIIPIEDKAIEYYVKNYVITKWDPGKIRKGRVIRNFYINI